MNYEWLSPGILTVQASLSAYWENSIFSYADNLETMKRTWAKSHMRKSTIRKGLWLRFLLAIEQWEEQRTNRKWDYTKLNSRVSYFPY